LEYIYIYIYIFKWAITKNGCTRSLFSHKRVHSKIKWKTHPTSHATAHRWTSRFLACWR